MTRLAPSHRYLKTRLKAVRLLMRRVSIKRFSQSESALLALQRFPVIPPLSALRQHSVSNMAVPTAKCLAAYAYLLLISLMFPHVFADSAAGDMPHRRFEYKYSFKGPHLTQSDGRIPFWIHTGSKFIEGCLSVCPVSAICISVCHLSVCLVHVVTCRLNSSLNVCAVALKWTESVMQLN